MGDLLTAHRHCSEHRAEIEASRLCGCFQCRQTFLPDEIVAWTGWRPEDLDLALDGAPDHLTALCPRCGSETVIGDASGFAIDADFLSRMNEAWCQRTMIYKPKPKG